MNDFSRLLQSIARQKIGATTDSRALLYWFLFNVFRLDEIESQDSVCDATNDKGIDGLWVDEDTQEVFLFQSKYTNRQPNTLGDKDLKEFVGSASWFSSPDNITKLLASAANDDLKALVKRAQLVDRLQAGFEVKLIFVTTRTLDTNGQEFLQTLVEGSPHLEVWDRPLLISQMKNLERQTRVIGQHKFLCAGRAIATTLSEGTRLHIGHVRALDIANMKGISDRSLFSLNVRSGLGRTTVNKELEKAIRERNQHQRFKLFHNGVTIICRKLAVAKNEIQVEDYSIVNGCQSAIAFHDNSVHLSSDLLILARFVEVGDDDALAAVITYRTNNQNGINPRDLKSNDRVQVALRRQFQAEFGNDFEYVIKAGEKPSARETLKNDKAGQMLMALYLDEPYNAHQKYRAFTTDYERVFGRQMNAKKIYLAYMFHKAVESSVTKIEDILIREYQLTKFVLLGLLGFLLRDDQVGRRLLDQPEDYLPSCKSQVEESVRIFTGKMAASFNYSIKTKQEERIYYDYKSEFKSPEKYRTMKNEMKRDHQRALVNHPDDRFESIFRSLRAPTP